VLNNYLHALNKVFKAISPSLEGFISKSIIFQSAINICDFIIGLTFTKHQKLDIDSFYDILKPLETNLTESMIKHPGRSYKTFSEKLQEATIMKSLPLKIIT
jgi:hypothetical protein